MKGHEGWKREAELTLPNTIGVGFGRSGTTYVSHVLSEHPEVCFSSRKETHFFSRHYQPDLSAYTRYFSHCRGRGAKVVAEWSVHYILNEDALLRIRDVLSNQAKLLVIYRDPVDSLRSALRFRIARGKADESLSARDLIECNWDLVENKFFDLHLERLFRIFPRQDIYIMHFEDMVQDPEGFFRALYCFLRIQYVPVHESISQMNVTRVIKSSAIQGLLYRFLRLMHDNERARRLLKTHPADQPRWLRVVQGWNSRPVNLEFDPSLCEELTDLFAPHMRNLEAMLLAHPNEVEIETSI
jgi:hypothetical protein